MRKLNAAVGVHLSTCTEGYTYDFLLYYIWHWGRFLL